MINAGLPIGAIAGPLFGGPVVHLLGQKAAIGLLGAIVLALAAVAAMEPEVEAPAHEHIPLRDSIRTVARDSWLLTANVALIVLAIAGTTMQTLGSLQLASFGRLAERRRHRLHARRDRGSGHDAHDRAHRRPHRPPQDAWASGTLLLAPAMARWRCRSARPSSSPRWSPSASRSRSASRPPTRWPPTAPSGRGVGQGVAMGLLSVSWGVGALDRPGAHRHGGRARERRDGVPRWRARWRSSAALAVRWRTRE